MTTFLTIISYKKKNENKKSFFNPYSIHIQSIFFCKKASSLKLRNCFFTQLVIVVDFKQCKYEIVPHVDKEDIIPCAITLGDPLGFFVF